MSEQDDTRALCYALFRSNIDWAEAAASCGDTECAGDCRYVAEIRQLVRKLDGGILPAPEGVEKVLVSKWALQMLYECAKDYERRIPAANGGDWADPFRKLFADGRQMGAGDE